jgi:hypothetical protein
MLSRESKLVALIFSVLLLLILKYIIDHSTEALPQVLQLVAYASLPIAGGLTTLSSCSLLRNFVDVGSWATSPLLRQFSEEQESHFFIGFIIVAYLSLIRPPLANYVPLLPYVEWVVIALLVYVMYTMTRQPTEEFYIRSETPSWKEHIQKVRRETGSDLIHITSLMERFVDHGVKEPLLVYLTLHLQRVGETEEGILKTLSSLIDYKEKAPRHKLYHLAFPWTKKELIIRNKKTRENLLNTLLEKIDRLRSEWI